MQVTAAGSARASREEGMAAAMAWPAARARTRAEIERILKDMEEVGSGKIGLRGLEDWWFA